MIESSLSDPECVLKPPLNLMGQQQLEPFQPISPAQTLGPAPVLMPPEPLAFPLCSPLSAKPSPHLQLFPNPAITAPLGSSPIPTENEFQATGSDQDIALEELCRPLYCKLCNVTLNSPQQAQAHYQVKIAYRYGWSHCEMYSSAQKNPSFLICSPQMVFSKGIVRVMLNLALNSISHNTMQPTNNTSMDSSSHHTL